MAKDIREIDKNMKENISLDDSNINWYDLNNDYLLGQAFRNNFERLPKGVYVSDNVEYLKKHPAGLNIIFKTNSRNIKLKAKLEGAAYMPHMTAVGTVGFALYVKNGKKWYFVNCTKINKAEYEVDLLKNIDEGEHEFRLYFPLYQGLIEAFVGVDSGSNFKFVKPKMGNIVIYGTSISQGGCATRPGNDYSAFLGRMLNKNVINLGFSGSCKVEAVMADVLNQIDKEVLILELESNCPSVDHMKTRLGYMLEHLENKDKFKIYIISHYDDGMMYVDHNVRVYREIYKDLQKSFEGVEFIDGEEITKCAECDHTVDGGHLNDLGFYIVAKALAKIIKKNK